MELNKVRRVSSAGYRLPEPTNATKPPPAPAARSVTVQKPPDSTRSAAGGDAVTAQRPGDRDPVQQDQVWREFIQTETRGVREWEKNWSFLTNYDQMGRLKPEQPPPSPVPLFSDRLPNTTNHMCGSRVSTPLGRELVRMDRMLLWSGRHHKSKPDPEMLPC